MFLHAVVLTSLLMAVDVESSDRPSTDSICVSALLNHVIRLIENSEQINCIIECNNEKRCQSLNYHYDKQQCELNNRTKEARPDDFVHLQTAYYMDRRDPVPLGSIPELPGNTCKEIKLSTPGSQTARYWIDPDNSNKPLHVVCNMTLEDVDECASGTQVHRCPANSTCTNTKGSYDCSCPSGYKWTGTNCTDFDECVSGTHLCPTNSTCTNTKGSYKCSCPSGYKWNGTKCTLPLSCSDIKKTMAEKSSSSYVIEPYGEDGIAPFSVHCDMTDKIGIGVTVVTHDSQIRTHVNNYEDPGSYSRSVTYTGATVAQLAALTKVSAHCEQFIKYECYHSILLNNNNPAYGWWVSRDGNNITYWGGAVNGAYKCACGMTNSCADTSKGCNCDKNDITWREDSGLLTDKSTLPVTQLRFGDTGYANQNGYHTLGELKCYGIT